MALADDPKERTKSNSLSTSSPSSVLALSSSLLPPRPASVSPIPPHSPMRTLPLSIEMISLSITHRLAEWSVGVTASTATKNCYGKTMRMNRTAYLGEYLEQMRLVDEVLKDMHSPAMSAYLLNITMLSALRKDGHTSIYSGKLSPK